MSFMRDSVQRHNDYMKQYNRGKIVVPVRVFNAKRVGHNIPVPTSEVVEVRPMSLKQIKKREMAINGVHALAVDSKEFYKWPTGPKVINWKAYGKNTPPERVSRILA